MHLKNKALKFIRQKSTEVYREIDKSVTWPYLQKFLRVFSLVSKLFPTLLSHGLLHARLPCPLATPEACPNSCQSSWWCHPHPYPQLSPSPPAFSLSHGQSVEGIENIFKKKHTQYALVNGHTRILKSNNYVVFWSTCGILRKPTVDWDINAAAKSL